ncbi:L,D-transpeptidase [Gaoshiqia sp. Z1-71]|uniref:L,D-transpeptidase n=1 Tax=Gaoshiqia hydrogeniformans TaxID=3290090 RepID=UPI003BF7D667
MIGEETKIETNKNGLTKKMKWRGRLFFYSVVLGAVLGFCVFIFSIVPLIKNSPLIFPKKAAAGQSVEMEMPDEKTLKTDILRLNNKLERLTPGGVYLVVNTSDNTFFLYKNRKLIREGLCSTGSYIRLELDDVKSWVFQTPKGVFTIKGKITSPVWRKPDWAFVEEGLPVPSANDPSRFEYGVLGDYALSLGDGYLIHGTLYQRFLGQPVTHGCIRMNDEDLETVYQTLPIGAKVFIY